VGGVNLNEECEDIAKDRPVEGNTQLDAAMNELPTEKEDSFRPRAPRGSRYALDFALPCDTDPTIADSFSGALSSMDASSRPATTTMLMFI